MTEPSKTKTNLSNVYYTMGRRKDTTICDAWKTFATFQKWAIEHEYESGARIIRIDKSKPFSPGNTEIVKCKYVNNMNKQLNKLIELI